MRLAIRTPRPPCRLIAARPPRRLVAPAAAAPARDPPPLLTAPTLLTLARVAAVPLLAVAWFRCPPKTAPLATASIFAAASITDALDGALARATGACTPFGAFLDPVADKLATTTALVLLASRQFFAGLPASHPWLVPACAAAVVGREVAMSALREWAAAAGPAARAAAAVSAAGKAKTALQMVAIVALLLASCRPCCAPQAGVGAWLYKTSVSVGAPALVGGTLLGLVSLAQYFGALWPWLSGVRTD